jgi:hypothetical protein
VGNDLLTGNHLRDSRNRFTTKHYNQSLQPALEFRSGNADRGQDPDRG